MTRSADYKCHHCHTIKDYDVEHGENLPDTITHWCHTVEGYWPMHRMYQAPHTGRGSSGEPAH